MSTEKRTRAWVEVRASAVRRNYRRIADAMGSGARLIPMVKADAYGLGADRAVATLEPLEPWGYGVAAVAEGRELRGLGVRRPVLVFTPLPPGSYGDAVRADLTPCLSDLEGLQRLERAATLRSGGGGVPFQVEIDTGMGRSGFDWREAERWGPVVAARHGGALRWTGVFTHLHSADEDEGSVRVQLERFRATLELLDRPGDDFLVHVANSAGALRSGGSLPPAARPGIFLYGGRAGLDLPPPEPVASLRARVVLLREVPPGTTLGYGATYAASSRERWATLAVGYGDGLPRALGNQGHALLKGTRVPIVGRISMDMTVVNISGLDGVELGDVATLVGREGAEEITVDEVADLVGTIGYEVLTGLTGRLPRIWVDDGEA